MINRRSGLSMKYLFVVRFELCLMLLHVLNADVFQTTAENFVNDESNDYGVIDGNSNLTDDSLPSNTTEPVNNLDVNFHISSGNSTNRSSLHSTNNHFTTPLLAANTTVKTSSRLSEGLRDNTTNTSVFNNYLSSVDYLLSVNKKSTSTPRKIILPALTTSMQYLNSAKQTSSLSDKNHEPTKPVFWDYGNKDDVEPADYDYQSVLKDEPEVGCYGFLRSRRNCRVYGNLGFIGILVIGFSFVLILLLCACKGCRCMQILLKKRLRYVTVSTKD